MSSICFQELFMQSKGQPISYKNKEIKMVDKINISSQKVKLKINFISTNSNYKQGIAVDTKGYIEIDEQIFKNRKMIFWEDTAPKVIELIVKSKDNVLIIHNIWEQTDHLGNKSTFYCYNGAALYLEKVSETTTIYHCNDGEPDDDFDDLIFKVEIEPVL